MLTKENDRSTQQDTTPTPAYLVANIPRRELTAIIGGPCTGKSTNAAELVAAVSAGRDSIHGPLHLGGPGTAMLCIGHEKITHMSHLLLHKGAEPERTYLCDCGGIPHLDQLMDCLIAGIRRTHLDLIVIDDIDELMQDPTNPTDYDWMYLQRLDDLAWLAGCAIVIVWRIPNCTGGSHEV